MKRRPLVTFSLYFRKHVRIVLVALAMIALAARSASADVVLNFLELPNESGIHLTGTDSGGDVIDVTLLGSETFRVSTPRCTMIPGCNPNFTTNQIGNFQTEFLVNILESQGGPLSDQIHVHRLTSAASFLVIDFISDDGTSFDTAGPGAIVTTLVETGSLQSGLAYASNAGTVNISFISDVSEAPEPATLPLLGIGIGAMLALSRRKIVVN